MNEKLDPYDPEAAFNYARKTLELANSNFDNILIHPIRWYKTHREVQRRLAVFNEYRQERKRLGIWV